MNVHNKLYGAGQFCPHCPSWVHGHIYSGSSTSSKRTLQQFMFLFESVCLLNKLTFVGGYLI